MYREPNADPPAVTFLAPDDEGWAVALRYEMHHGRMRVVDLHIFRADRPAPIGRPQNEHLIDTEDGQRWIAHIETTRSFDQFGAGLPGPREGADEITTSLIRKLRIGNLDEYARQRMHELFPDLPTRAAKRRGPTGKPRAYYARLARDYVALVDDGNQTPIVELANRADPPINVRTMETRVRRAGTLGYLDRTGLGRTEPGGTLTEAARQILDITP